MHILEGPIAFVMAAMYILGTVISGYPLFSGIGAAAGAGRSLHYVLATLDSFLYIYSWHLSCLILRLITVSLVLFFLTVFSPFFLLKCSTRD
jgi:hypothetical protein